MKNTIILLVCILVISCKKEEKQILDKQKYNNIIQNYNKQKNLDNDTISIDSISKFKSGTLSNSNDSFNCVNGTPDGGFVYISDLDGDGGYTFIKINKNGEKVFEKTFFDYEKSTGLKKPIDTKITVSDNNYIILTKNKIKLLNDIGEVVIEKNIENLLTDIDEIKKIYCFENNEIILIGEEYMSNPRIIKLDLDFNLLNTQNFRHIYNIFGCKDYVHDCRNLDINSIIKDNSSNYYFTGTNDNNFWIGKLDNNLNVIWDRNNYDYEMRYKPSKGLTILYENDKNIFVLSEYTSYKGETYLMSINYMGDKNWSTIIKGSTYSNDEDFMIKFNNNLYTVTHYTDFQYINRKKHVNPRAVLMQKFDFEGNLVKSQKLLYSKYYMNFIKGISNKSYNCFYVNGLITREIYNDYFSTNLVSKFDINGNIENKSIDLTSYQD